MKIRIKDNTDIYAIENVIYRRVNNSRFKVGNLIHETNKTLKVSMVRLDKSKRYCGSHPYACDIERGRTSNYLEGADWVEFNDLINDALDGLMCSANVSTSVCIIRKLKSRRINYRGFREQRGGRLLNNNEWVKDGEAEDYEDWCGKIAPNSIFPEGTPGIYARGSNG